MFTEKKFKATDVEINYAVGPANGKPLLILHGVTGNWTQNQILFPFVINHWQIYAPDFRYHGKSGRVNAPISVRNYAKDIIELIKDEIKEPVHIIGHSLGGMVSMIIASEIPELVSCVINCDGGWNKENINKWCEPTAKVSDGIIKIMESSETKNDLFMKFAYAPIKLSPDEEPIPTLDAPLVNVGNIACASRSYKFLDPLVVSSFKNIIEILDDYNAEEFLPKITCPVFLLKADSNIDALMIDEDIELAKKHVKNLVYKKFTGIGHNLYHDDLSEVVRYIVPYLNMFLD
ncbi:MAG: alpha/beta hydrolase [Asgard group archaeon]|nr:alpha/beta hydrolase [Asgard group archaeon]